MTEQPTVRPGQIWADNDKRNEGRTLRVETITHVDGKPHTVRCTILTNTNEVQASLDAVGQRIYSDARGKQTHIRLDRMRPTSTGYRLIQDA